MVRKVAPPPDPTGLYFAREHRGLSQDELAAASGAKKPMISKLESGARELTRSWAERFAGPLRLSAIRIVFWDKVGPAPTDAEAEYDIPAPNPRMVGRVAEPRPAGLRASNAPRPKELKSAVIKLYIKEYRNLMGVPILRAAAAIDLDSTSYRVLETYPFRLTGEQMGKLADAIGVNPDQFWFPPRQISKIISGPQTSVPASSSKKVPGHGGR